METMKREQWLAEVADPIIAEYVNRYSPEENTMGMWHELEGLNHESGMSVQEYLGHHLSELWINYLLAEGVLQIA